MHGISIQFWRKQVQTYLLVLLGSDLLQEISNALPLRQLEAQAIEEGHCLLFRPVIHNLACNLEGLVSTIRVLG